MLDKNDREVVENTLNKAKLPDTWKKNITPEFIEKLGQLSDDPVVCKQMRENFLMYLDYGKKFKCNIQDYLNAVKYVSLKLLGYTQEQAYTAVFPKLAENHGEYTRQYANQYNGTKLVNAIFEQTLIPSYIINAPYYQEAINKLVEVIRDPNVRGMTKVKACEAILNATKPPEVNELNVNISNNTQNEALEELRAVTSKLATTFQEAVKNKKLGVVEMAEMKLIQDADFEEVVGNG